MPMTNILKIGIQFKWDFTEEVPQLCTLRNTLSRGHQTSDVKFRLHLLQT